MSSPNLEDLPPVLAAHTGYLLVRLGKHAQRLFSLAIAPVGLRPPHADIMLLLADSGALAQVEVAQRLNIERAHLVALLDQLEGMQLLLRAADPHDRRRHAVRLTTLGEAVAAQIATIAATVQRQLLGDLSAQEVEQFRATLQRLARDADEGD
jgi:DNA-binding MarR family transcriptional regulator